MRHSYQILVLCFAIIIALLLYTLSENHKNTETSHIAWQKYDENFVKLMHISIMFNQMQHLTRIYLATTTTDDPFELDELIISASAKRSIYIEHYQELKQLHLNETEQHYLERVSELAGKIRLDQMAYDEILSQGTPLKQRLHQAIHTIITPQNQTQVLMQNFLHYIRSNTISDSIKYHEQEKKGHHKIENLQLTTIYLTFFLAFFSILIIFKNEKTIRNKNRALARAESFLHSTLNSTPVALIIVNKSGQIIMANSNAASIFNYSQEHLITMNISDLIPEKIRHKHHQHLLAYCQNPGNRGMSSGLVITAQRQSGEIFPAEVGLSPVDKQDELYIACSIKDITTQKAMEKEILDNKNRAEQANQAKSEFLANVSHELRTPLHAILSFSRLGLKNIQQTAVPSNSTRKLENYLDRIHTSGNKLLGFINDLLDSSKFESGKMQLEYHQHDIVRLIESFLSEQEARIQELKLKISTTVAAYNQSACFDQHYIAQAINNLIYNAIKYSPKGGTINISINTCQLNNRNAIQFTIEDEGPGIPEDQLSLIFDRFVQSSNKFPGGTGLGLSLCKSIIQAHGGRIWAENQHKTARGHARFSFIIPEQPETTVQK